jgi:hypothetical protein
MSVITKILCSVTILVAAVSLTIPSQVFAGGGPIIPSTTFSFDLALVNNSNTDIQYTICAEDSRYGGFFNYPSYDATRDSPSGIAQHNNGMMQQIPATKSYNTHIEVSLPNVDISKGIRILVSPALSQPARVYGTNDCDAIAPKYGINTIIPADNTNKKLAISGVSNGSDKNMISRLKFIRTGDNYYSPVPAPATAQLQTFIRSFASSDTTYNLCIDGAASHPGSGYQGPSVSLSAGQHTIQYPEVNTGCSPFNYSKTITVQDNVRYDLRSPGFVNKKVFVASSTPAATGGVANFIFMRGTYPASEVCIDGIKVFENISGMGNMTTTPGVHSVAYSILQCPATAEQITFVEGSNTLAESGYFDEISSNYVPAKPGFYAYQSVTDKKSLPISSLSIDGVLTSEAYPGSNYFEFSGTKTVALVDAAQKNIPDTSHLLTYDQIKPEHLTLQYDYKPDFVLTGLSLQVMDLAMDLNNDGTPDVQQATTANTADDTSENNILYVSSKNGKSIKMSKKGYQYWLAKTDARYSSFPFGLADFTIEGVLPGEVNTVDIGFLMTEAEFNTFMTDARKNKPAAANPAEITLADIQNTRLRVIKWAPSAPGGTDFDFRDFTNKVKKIDTTQAATMVNGKSYKRVVLTMELIDGQPGDQTGVDGKIVDPIGLALIPETPAASTPAAATLSKTGLNMTTVLVSSALLGTAAIGATVVVRYKRKTK